jgi:hypothetical protein
MPTILWLPLFGPPILNQSCLFPLAQFPGLFGETLQQMGQRDLKFLK